MTAAEIIDLAEMHGIELRVEGDVLRMKYTGDLSVMEVVAMIRTRSAEVREALRSASNHKEA